MAGSCAARSGRTLRGSVPILGDDEFFIIIPDFAYLDVLSTLWSVAYILKLGRDEDERCEKTVCWHSVGLLQYGYR